MKTVVAMREASASDTRLPPPPEAPAAPPAPAAAIATADAARPARSAFLPLLLGLLALTLWLAFQAWLQNQDRLQLQQAGATIRPSVEQSATLRQSLDRLARDTQSLANAGNGNARVLVEELRKRGITINASAAGTAPTATR